MTNRAVVAAALLVLGLAALLAVTAIGNLGAGPTGTSYIVGPDGDDVIIAPRAAP